METIGETNELRKCLQGWHGSDRVGLTPTMGNLHKGHLALVEAARRDCEIVVMSIFVNPMQFGAGEDYSEYPRTLEADRDKLAKAGVDILFAPSLEDVYPDGQSNQTIVSVPELSIILCGASRPHHFDGVTTVVAKLLNMVQPDAAYFGEKDWQQLVIIRTMVRQLNMPIDVIGVPIVREEDGVALSSRNEYLSEGERSIAPLLHQTLQDVCHAISEGERNFASLEQTAKMALKRAGFEPEYVAVRDDSTLLLPNDATQSLRILAAARLGQARLIDNVSVEL